MFENIIGYDSVKSELLKFHDIMIHPENYKTFNASIPKGILLYGDPGVGKTMCALELINNSNRPVYTIKAMPDIQDKVTDIFNDARDNAPSIIFLDDMDKYSEMGQRSIYCILQDLIDSVRNHDVFIIGTANDLCTLPRSMIRHGRFDRLIHLSVPSSRIAQDIMCHYLANRPIDTDVDIKDLAKMLDRKSCATLESVINMASINAGYDRSPTIKMSHIVEAILTIVHDKPESSAYEYTADELKEVAYHEAGHAVVAELLCPNSTSLVTIRRVNKEDCCITSNTSEDISYDVNAVLDRIRIALAGKAASEIALNRCDIGCWEDIRVAASMVMDLLQHYAYGGFYYTMSGLGGYEDHHNDTAFIRAESVFHQYLDTHYKEVIDILTSNWNFVEAIAGELMEKKTLIASDIRRIKAKLGIYGSVAINGFPQGGYFERR